MGENFVASAVPAFLSETRSVIFPEDGEIVVVRSDRVQVLSTWTARRSTARWSEVDWDEEAAEKGGYETFMLKEIHEQPDGSGRHPGRSASPADGPVVLDELGLSPRTSGR